MMVCAHEAILGTAWSIAGRWRRASAAVADQRRRECPHAVLDRRRRRCTRPAICRRCAPATGRAAGAAMRALDRRAVLPVDVGEIGGGQRVETGEEAGGARGFHRHFSSRWLRQKARSKAGSPYQAHSASRNTGPFGRPGCSSGRRRHGRARACSAAVVSTSAAARRRDRGWRCGGEFQIGLEPDGAEESRRR